MREHKDILSLLKWSHGNEKDPLFRIAQKWISNEKIEKICLMHGLQRISEISRSEIHNYNNFELMKMRRLLLSALTEDENFDLSLVEHSLNQTKNFDLLDGICLTVSIVVCLTTGWFL